MARPPLFKLVPVYSHCDILSSFLIDLSLAFVRTTYGTMNEWMKMKDQARTIPKHVPITLTDANWREIKAVRKPLNMGTATVGCKPFPDSTNLTKPSADMP